MHIQKRIVPLLLTLLLLPPSFCFAAPEKAEAAELKPMVQGVDVSAYNGYIYKLTNGDLTDSVKVGGYPEAMSVANGKLYVNMSDYKYNNSGKSISVIDLKSFKKTKELDCELNPYNQSVAVGNKVYFVSTYHADQDGALQCIDALAAALIPSSLATL